MKILITVGIPLLLGHFGHDAYFVVNHPQLHGPLAETEPFDSMIVLSFDDLDNDNLKSVSVIRLNLSMVY